MEEMVSAEALRESEALHRITLQSMSDAVFITDDAGVFTFICPNVDVIFGHSHDEVRQMGRISRLLGGDLIDPAELMRCGEIRNIEHDIETKDGRTRCLLVHAKSVSIRGGSILYACRDITERKESERALSRNEQRLALALEAAGAGTWDWEASTGTITWSPEMQRILGDAAGPLPGSFEAFLNRVHPSDRDRVASTMTAAMQQGDSYETLFRLYGSDSVERWVIAKGRGLRNGKPLRMLGVFVDFTDRHRVEHALQDLSGRFLNAQEQERSRLARELHDDVGQRLAMHAVEVSLLRQRANDGHDVAPVLLTLANGLADSGTRLHQFSVSLHPARLEQLGFERSIRHMCQDISEARGIDIDLSTSTLPEALPAHVTLCLYRCVQEALHNVVKHSRSSRASVTFIADADTITLRVMDEGVGFDPADLPPKDTLGLVSMRERARLVSGRLTLTSKRGEGTCVEVHVPLRRKSGPFRLAPAPERSIRWSPGTSAEHMTTPAQEILSDTFRRFFGSEKAGGVVLIICTAISLLLANSALARELPRAVGNADRRIEPRTLDQRRADGGLLPVHRSRARARALQR